LTKLTSKSWCSFSPPALVLLKRFASLIILMIRSIPAALRTMRYNLAESTATTPAYRWRLKHAKRTGRGNQGFPFPSSPSFREAFRRHMSCYSLRRIVLKFPFKVKGWQTLKAAGGVDEKGRADFAPVRGLV
jgi:hypothetical protein